MTEKSFTRLYDIVKRLRADDGCPWDREQTPETLRGDLIEECYECVEAINEKNPNHIKEELGDVFLLATMISYMHEQKGTFTVSDALEEVCDKLVRRHPHVFGNSTASNSSDVLSQWDRIKIEQEGRKPKDSVLDKVSKGLPPLERAYELQKKAAKAGFDWEEASAVWKKVEEELAEAQEAHRNQIQAPSPENATQLEAELGDLLFSVVNICRFLHIDPAIALNRTNTEFTRRFKYVEKGMKESGQPMEKGKQQLMDQYWNEAKKNGYQ